MNEVTRCWCGGGAETHPELGIARCLSAEGHDPLATGKITPGDVKVLYLSGPMTGYEQCNYPEFNRISNLLRKAGFEVLNPAESTLRGHYLDFMREDFRMVLDAQGVATHGSWTDSRGAMMEVELANKLEMPVMTWTKWIELMETREQHGTDR